MPSSASDSEAEFVALLTEHQAALRLYVASLLPGDPAVADVTQQANTTIWRKRSDFEIGTNFKAWSFAVARYEVLNFRKAQARDRRLVFSDEMEEIFSREIPASAAEQDSRYQALQECLQGLKKADRELVLHRYFSEDSLKEYADEVQRSVGSLKVTLHRIRNKLAGCINATVATNQRRGRA